jgi:hypothetical protein
MTCNIVNLYLLVGIMVISVLTLGSCKHKPKPELTKTSSLNIKLSNKTESSFDTHWDNLSLFDLERVETDKNDTAGFVSVSNIYEFPGSIDSLPGYISPLVIPDLTDRRPEETRYFTLTSKYRKRMLTGTRISENDSLFVYNYAKDILLGFPIKALNAVANLSIYEDPGGEQHSATDYQFGFEISRKLLPGLIDHYFENTLVYIGAANPFNKGKMHPIVWKKADLKEIPVVKLKDEDSRELRGYVFSDAYIFESDAFHFYLQKFVNNEQSISLRLIIINSNGQVVYNLMDYETESSSPAPISVVGNDKNELIQWVGRLLKNKPILIVGLDYIEFGCPILPFIDKSEKYVNINCDNRH